MLQEEDVPVAVSLVGVQVIVWTRSLMLRHIVGRGDTL